MSKKTTKPKVKEVIVEKIVEVPQSYSKEAESFLKQLQQHYDIPKHDLVEALIYDSIIDSRRYGVLAIAARMNTYHSRLSRERI